MAADERLGFELETISTSELFGELKSQLVGLPQASVYNCQQFWLDWCFCSLNFCSTGAIHETAASCEGDGTVAAVPFH